jgi:hypothetical protein
VLGVTLGLAGAIELGLAPTLTVWIYKQSIQRRIKSYDLDFYLSDGWKTGFKPDAKVGKSTKGRIWITKDTIDKMVYLIEFTTTYENLGWKRGRYSALSSTKKQKKNNI